MQFNRRYSLLTVASGAQLRRLIWPCLVFASVSIAACSSGPDDEGELLVFAAASLGDALTAVKVEFEAEIDIAISYGGSQMLARQISSGAPADVFISAGEFPINMLVEEGLVEGEPVQVLTNRLVVVTQPDGVRVDTIEQLATDVVGRLAIADPELAPAGAYSKEVLIGLGMWEAVEGKLLFGADVRATLVYVQTGNADAALVYETDAATARDLLTLVVPPESYSSVVYPGVIVRKSEKKDRAAEFVKLLMSDRAREIFRQHGFGLPGP